MRYAIVIENAGPNFSALVRAHNGMRGHTSFGTC